MAKYIITIEIEHECNACTGVPHGVPHGDEMDEREYQYHMVEREDLIALLFRDALGEFCSRRGSYDRISYESARKYVEERYADASPKFREQKIGEIVTRCYLAVTIARACHAGTTFKVEKR